MKPPKKVPEAVRYLSFACATLKYHTASGTFLGYSKNAETQTQAGLSFFPRCAKMKPDVTIHGCIRISRQLRSSDRQPCRLILRMRAEGL